MCACVRVSLSLPDCSLSDYQAMQIDGPPPCTFATAGSNLGRASPLRSGRARTGRDRTAAPAPSVRAGAKRRAHTRTHTHRVGVFHRAKEPNAAGLCLLSDAAHLAHTSGSHERALQWWGGEIMCTRRKRVSRTFI